MEKIDFVLDEIVKIKGCFFKIVLIDWFTGKIGLKLASKEECEAHIKNLPPKQGDSHVAAVS